MGSFFGFGNYEKPGKGVRKDEPQKNRFFLFFELYFRNFWRLFGLNILYVIACIPIVTFGPATTAMVRLTSDYAEHKPVFLWHDFWNQFKKNFKSSFWMGLIEVITMIACLYAILFFTINMDKQSFLIYIGFFAAIFFSIIFLFTFLYSWIISAKIELKTIALLKNSFVLAALSIKQNLVIAAFLIVYCYLIYLFFPFSVILLPFISMTTLGFLISYLYFPYVYTHLMKPYYDQSGVENPYEPHEEENEYEYVYTDEDGNEIKVDENGNPIPEKKDSIFSDAPELERSSLNSPDAVKSKNKSIK